MTPIRYAAVRRYVHRTRRRCGHQAALDVIRFLWAASIISGWQAAALTLEV